MTKAILLGATGLTGSALLKQLLEDPLFSQVTAISRRSLNLTHPKFKEVIVDFAQPELWTAHVQGDVAFSTMGTTKRDAGSFPAQYRVDYEYQFKFAKAAELYGVKSFILMSSMGADAGSSVPYSRMKGQLDLAVNVLAIPRVRIIRPGILDGNRLQPRPVEHLSISIARFLTSFGIARKYRPISVRTVAKAMIASVFDGDDRRRIYEGEEVFTLADAQHPA